jgi:aminoethylphosphonate catabolism LysR family transcriptional regulator
MTPAQARAFQAVALEGSFTAAARRLSVSQPTVTSQIKQLERAFKVELFHRTGRGVRLTHTGSELLSIVRRMFGSYQEAIEFLQEAEGMRRGHLRVGSYGPYDVIRMLARFSERYPGVKTSLAFANSRDLTKKLLQYDLDVAVLGHVEERPEFHTLQFSAPPLVAIAPRTAPWSTRTHVDATQFGDQTLILREAGSAARAAFEQLLADARVPLAKVVEVGSREGVVSAVAIGMGISVIFNEGLLPADRVVKLPIANCSLCSNVDVVCLSERKQSLAVSAFLTIAEELLTESSATEMSRGVDIGLLNAAHS